jgi:hypothetical protein
VYNLLLQSVLIIGICFCSLQVSSSLIIEKRKSTFWIIKFRSIIVTMWIFSVVKPWNIKLHLLSRLGQ